MQKGESEISLILVGGTLLLLFLVSFIVLFMLFYQQRYFRQERRIREIREEAEKELLKAQLEIQEVELNRVSLEIHDNAGQMLSLVKLNLNVLESRMGAGIQDLKLLAETKTLVSDIISDLRNLSKSLASDMVERYGFLRALNLEIDRIQRTEQFKCNVIVCGTSSSLPLDTEIVLFRMVQESLQNIIKHSKTSKIDIKLDYANDYLVTEVSDYGIGFEPQKIIAHKSAPVSGLRTLFARAKLIGAFLEVISTPGNGSVIRIKLPLLKSA